MINIIALTYFLDLISSSSVSSVFGTVAVDDDACGTAGVVGAASIALRRFFP